MKSFMKKMMLAGAVLAVLPVLAACDKPGGDDTPQADVTGIWELSSVSTKASVGGVNVNVYLEFGSDGSFDLYQKIGEGRYTYFEGTYVFDKEQNQLTGNYAGGSAWGPYAVEQQGSSLTLTSRGGKEVDSYKKIDAIPASVTDNLY